MIPNPTPSWWPEHLEVVDPTVDVSQLDKSLQDYLTAAAALHWQDYLKPLEVTSGNDGNHAPGSKHCVWKAVDLRSRDLTEDEQDAFTHTLTDLQGIHKVGVFDERYIGQPHWHVEAA